MTWEWMPDDFKAFFINLNFYWFSKTFKLFMAKIDLKFLDFYDNYDYIKATKTQSNDHRDNLIHINGFDSDSNIHFNIYLDKSTAIKFSKTIRTEIAKITAQEKEGGSYGDR